MREELDAGLRPVLSSDSFVSSLRPMETVSNAVRRRTREGGPIGAEQAVTLEEALRAHTVDAAYALRMEDVIGSLAPRQAGRRGGARRGRPVAARPTSCPAWTRG
ncbi:amidohydrolase family protein [Nonomuraea ferruginea]